MMFKERLAEVRFYFLFTVFALILFFGSFWILSILPFNLGAYFIIGLMLLALLMGVGVFLNWLVIEPVRYSETYKKWKAGRE